MKNKSLSELESGAKAGSCDALFSLAVCYDRGEGGDCNPTRAVYYYALAAEAGERRADFRLGECYRDGCGAVINLKEAEYRFRKAGDGGIGAAFVALAKLTEKENLPLSVSDLYKKAAMCGDSEGEYRYAQFLLKEENKAENEELAKYYFSESFLNGYIPSAVELAEFAHRSNDFVAEATFISRAAKLGDGRGMLKYAKMLEEGTIVKKNLPLSLRYYADAYICGEKAASFPLARYFYEKIANDGDERLAGTFLEEAIALKIPEAYCYAGEIAKHGRYGAPQNEELAASHYRHSAEGGDSDGKARYGESVLLGIGEEADFKKAFRIISESAEEGSSYGIYLLAFCYEKGFGVPIDYKKAVEYYARIQNKSISDAKERYCLLQERLLCLK